MELSIVDWVVIVIGIVVGWLGSKGVKVKFLGDGESGCLGRIIGTILIAGVVFGIYGKLTGKFDSKEIKDSANGQIEQSVPEK